MATLALSPHPTQDRLITAVLNQWQIEGSSGISARRLAAQADVPVSSIYHHFDSLEELQVCAQQRARHEAENWCAALLEAIGDFPACPEAFGGFFAHVIDAWCEAQRHLAFAWRECDSAPDTEDLIHGEAQAWQRLWYEFWREACAHFQVSHGRVITKRIFDTESMFHLMRWHRAIDQAALGELARTLGSWLAGTPPPPTPWRDHTRALALKTMPALPERDETARRIVEAAQQVLAEGGSPHLTHRRVARRAELTLGTVSHKFPTKSELLGAAFEGAYSVMVDKLDPRSFSSADLDAVIHAIADSISSATRERARNELFLAVARDPALSHFGRQLRYLRGRTGRGLLQSLVGSQRTITATEGALFSDFSLGQIRRHALFPTYDICGQIRAEFVELLALFERPSPDA